MTRIGRRRVLIGLAATAAAGTGLAVVRRPGPGASPIAPEEAHRRAAEGDLTLVDIRRPDEWRATGVAAGAKPLDMRRDDFIAALTDELGGDRDRPVAVICARGVRSSRLSRRLEEAGFTQVHDVSEGMLGSGAGPGWLERGLPTIAP